LRTQNRTNTILTMPPREYHFWVYILASRSHNFYVGMTNNLRHRIETHKQANPGTYTAE
jgi:putative endonuclease